MMICCLQPSATSVAEASRSSIAFLFHKNVCCGSSYERGGRQKCSRIVAMATSSDQKGEPQTQGTNPYDVLGLKQHGCSQEDVKGAFRARVKEFHPDVYKGREDAAAITRRLIRAYERVIADLEDGITKSDTSDPFEAPECVAEDVFVNEFVCLGRGCPYSCVATAPKVFTFADDTGRARAVAQVKAIEYDVQLAVGQCPRLCIHYVTPAQRVVLEDILRRALEGPMFSGEVFTLDGLIARANFENRRYMPQKRQPKRSTKTVDWF